MIDSRPFDQNSTAIKIITDMRLVHEAYGTERMLSKEDGYMDDFHFYIQNTANYLVGLESWLEQLEHGIKRLDSYRKSEYASDGKGYIYEFENYSIRLNSLYDRVLQFVNAAFDTGIAIDKVNHGLIASNTKLKVYPQVFLKLKNVRKLIEKYAQRRHTLIHKHSLREKEYMDITLHSNSSMWKLIYGDDHQDFEKMALEKLRKQSEKDSAKFGILQKEITIKLNELISLCDHQYERQKERLKLKS